MKHLALALILTATPALATQEYILPTLFDVHGVAANDTLNIRAEPNARAAVVGTLSPGATRVEVVEERGGWGRVLTGEGTGWVNMRYLATRTDVWEPGKLPQGFACLGTEPFWSLSFDAGGMVFSTPETKTAPQKVTAIHDTGVFRDPTRAVTAGEMVLVATPQICSDGMSDRLFGLRATLLRTGDHPAMWSGCCSVAGF